MTDKLRQAAQDVIEQLDELLEANLQYTYETKKLRMFIRGKMTESLREALAEPDCCQQAIEAHDDAMSVQRTINMRAQAQPYLDALIAEIDDCFDGMSANNHIAIKATLNKYRSEA